MALWGNGVEGRDPLAGQLVGWIRADFGGRWSAGGGGLPTLGAACSRCPQNADRPEAARDLRRWQAQGFWQLRLWLCGLSQGTARRTDEVQATRVSSSSGALGIVGADPDLIRSAVGAGQGLVGLRPWTAGTVGAGGFETAGATWR